MTSGHARKNRIRRDQERTGASYTSVDAATLHDHDHGSDGMRVFSVPYAGEYPGKPADAQLVARLYDAALDGCRACRTSLLDRIAERADATTCLVAWVCLAASETFGGLPEDLTDNPWLPAPWREIATAYERTLSPETVAGLCAAMTAEQRHEAAGAAADIVVALTHHSGSDVRAPGDIRYCPVCGGGEDGHPHEVYLASEPGVWGIVMVTDPVLATASRVYQQAAGDPQSRSIGLYEAIRSVIVAALPGGEADYEAYPARLEDFAIRHRERLRDLFARYGPETRAGGPGPIDLLDHFMSVPLCEQLDSARPALEEAWGRAPLETPLADLAAAWDSIREG